MDALNWSHIITKLVFFSGKFPDIATRRSVPVILSSALGSEWSAMLHSERTHRDKFLSTESCGLQHSIAGCNFPEFRKFLPNFLLRYSITWTDIVESSNTQKQIAQWTPASNLSPLHSWSIALPLFKIQCQKWIHQSLKRLRSTLPKW